MDDRMLTPVGRIVQGSVSEQVTRDFDGKPLPPKPDGSPDLHWFIALAIPKTDPGWPAIQAMLVRAALAGNPCGVGPDGQATGTFSWKYEDGDSTTPNQKGNRPCDREGFPSNWVLKLKTNFLFSCFNNNKDVIDARDIKLGYFVIASVSAAPNNKTGNQAGVFLNLHGLKLHAEGPIIQVGPGYEALFGGAPGITTTLPPATGSFAQQPVNSPPPPPPPVNNPPPPDPAFLNGAPPPAAAPTEPQPPVGFRMTGKFSYANAMRNGWTDETLKSNGHMVTG